MFSPTVTLIAVAVLAALSVGALIYGLMYSRFRGAAQAEKRIDQIQTRPAVGGAKGRAVVDPNKRRKSVQDSLKEMEDKQKAKSASQSAPSLAMRIQQAGLSWSRQTFIIISVVLGAAGFAIPYFLNAPLYAAAGLAVAGALGMPLWIVNFLRKRRFKKFLKEFPNSVDIIVRGIKAGLPLNDCMRIIAAEAAEPVRSEFRQIHEQQALGMAMGDAVARLPDRVPVPEANFFAIVIAIQQRAGGNLAEALGNLSKVLRERARLVGKVKALSAEAKASAYIIGSLPLIVMFLVYLTSPDYIMLLFTTQIGNLILLVAGVWASMGVLIMRRMINFDF